MRVRQIAPILFPHAAKEEVTEQADEAEVKQII